MLRCSSILHPPPPGSLVAVKIATLIECVVKMYVQRGKREGAGGQIEGEKAEHTDAVGKQKWRGKRFSPAKYGKYTDRIWSGYVRIL